MTGHHQLHLRAGGVSLVLDVGAGGPPAVLHWGRDLGTPLAPSSAWVPAVPHSALDVAPRTTMLGSGLARPGLLGSRHGRAFAPQFDEVVVDTVADNEVRLRCVAHAAGLSLATHVRLDPHGVVQVANTLRNEGDAGYQLDRLGVVLPVPAYAVELLDLTGRWSRERHPQRQLFDRQGTWLRESRCGRPGHDAPLLTVLGSAGFGNRSGDVWGAHLAWSGSTQIWAERRPSGLVMLGLAELLEPGEVVLGTGEEYAGPVVHAVFDGAGLDGLSRRLHRSVRSRSGHVRKPRPVVLNTWEAVYFDHRLDRLTALADVAAEIGVERFVLDDGWFLHRRHDRAGLGDWVVDPQVWPDGLDPLIRHVRGLGMEFGLWVEPEMVNVNSDLYRAHPDWVLRPDEATDVLPAEWRHQQVLDLVRPDAWQHIHDRLDALLAQHDIGFLKWDHNRDLVDAGHAGRPAARAQTLAVYRLLDSLRGRHPGVEIESCASGGARVDLGILARTDRVWASDSNDALERVTIQRWTQLLLPPELVGSHVGPTTAHTSGRTHTLSFRGAVALFGHFGIEWDIASIDPEERAALRALVATYRTHRQLLHSGEVVHADHPDPAALVHGVVATDRSEALMAYVAVASGATEIPLPARLPGLDPERAYRVSPVATGGDPVTVAHAAPPWLEAEAFTATGRHLGEVGLPMPVLAPEQALVLHLQAV
ncbi:MAG: alpha-galactosidase [Sporichthyaceae bacterium]|nr:alpha-galactosidase [Sporichthyaceae bacterium]